jgi:CAAX prenyl protease-like protein
VTTTTPQTKGYGWSPYWAPFLAFMLLIEIGRRAPESSEFAFLVAKVVLPGLLVLLYLGRKAYPELLGLRWTLSGTLGDIGIGLLGAALWVAPFLLFDGLRPEPGGAFDPTMRGEAGVASVLAVRFLGYALVTPFVEELFVRSWLLRFIDVVDTRRDFRKVPMARFTWRSFLVVVGFFVFTHQPWEWGVMFAWTLLTMAWFYYRGHLAPLVLAHAVTNGAIWLFVVLCDGQFLDGDGNPISLYFFL